MLVSLHPQAVFWVTFLYCLPIRKFSLLLLPVYRLPQLFYYFDNSAFPLRSLNLGVVFYFFVICGSLSATLPPARHTPGRLISQ